MKCKCGKELTKKQRKYCSEECNAKSYYLRHREKIIAKTREWERKNPARAKENHKKAFIKFRKEQPERFNKLMMDGYYRNKDKWNSRKSTLRVTKSKEGTDIKKECKKCKSKDNLWLRFEQYPTRAKQIRKAIKQGKIYYLCKECRYETKSKRKNM